MRQRKEWKECMCLFETWDLIQGHHWKYYVEVRFTESSIYLAFQIKLPCSQGKTVKYLNSLDVLLKEGDTFK